MTLGGGEAGRLPGEGTPILGHGSGVVVKTLIFEIFGSLFYSVCYLL